MRPRLRPLLGAALLVLVVPLTSGLTSAVAEEDSSPARVAPELSRAKPPGLDVTVRVGGLSHPWDVAPIGGGDLLVTQRAPARLTLVKGHTKRTVDFPSGRVYTEGETGLMGLAVDPGFTENRRFYTCSGWKKGSGGHDVRVIAWTLSGKARKATLVKTLVAGLPSTSGRHGGCRLLITRSGALIVGTGDAAVGTNPRDLTSLSGKTLRLDRRTGKPWPENPFIGSSNRHKRYLLTYGHRNVQGLAQRSDGSVWSIEQGSFRDDEVNLLKGGGDYGWNPVPGYNEQVPMTDTGLPGPQRKARWRSGPSTIATSGGTFVYGKQWRGYDGALAVAALKGERVVFLTFDRSGHLTRSVTPKGLRKYGRLRTVVQLPGGRLLVATDGDGADGRILVVSPR